MSDDSRSGMLGEGEATVRSGNESLEDVPASSSGEGDVAGRPDRLNGSDHDNPAAPPADADIEHVSRSATRPSIETEAEADPQAQTEAAQGKK